MGFIDNCINRFGQYADKYGGAKQYCDTIKSLDNGLNNDAGMFAGGAVMYSLVMGAYDSIKGWFD